MTQPIEGGTPPANPPAATPMFTQQYVDHQAAQARRGALEKLFKDAGFDKAPTAEELPAIVNAALEHQKQQAGQKGDVERLTGELATANEKAAKVPTLEAALKRAQMAGDAGLKSKYHKYVEGETDEEIEASIKDVLADVGGGGSGSAEGEGEGEGEQPKQEPKSTKTGTGAQPPAPNPQQGSGGGSEPKSTMAAGRDAYKAQYVKE